MKNLVYNKFMNLSYGLRILCEWSRIHPYMRMVWQNIYIFGMYVCGYRE